MPTSLDFITDKVQKKAVNQLYEHYLSVLNAESIASLVFVVMLWGGINHTLLLSWLVVNLGINAFARVLSYIYHRAKQQSRISDIHIWKRWFVFSVLLGGTVWGLAGFLFYYASDDLRRIIIILMLTAIAGSANGELFPSKISYIAFVTPIYIAMLTLAFSQNILIYRAIFCGVLLFIIFTGLSAYTSSIALEKALRLRFINRELIRELSTAKKQLEHTNLKLQKEIEIRAAAEETLKRLARHDYLTGLPNRTSLNEKLVYALEEAKRKNSFLALLFIDLDSFKKINDSLGHDIGDQLLRETSHRLIKIMRKKDFLARIGGDEFFIIIENMNNIDEIKSVAKKICYELSSPFFINDEKILVSASIGISVYPFDSFDLKTLLKHADVALYKVKSSGKNNYLNFSEDML